MDGVHTLTATPSGLARRWADLREEDPLLGPADAAHALDVSEVEIVASACGAGAVRLQGPFGDLLRALPTLGTVRAATRAAGVEMEVAGSYPAPDAGSAGAVGSIGARVHLDHWAAGYAILDPTLGVDGPTLCFFDERGDAVHTIRAEARTDRRAFERLIDVFACYDQSPGHVVVVAGPPTSRARVVGSWLRRDDQARPVSLGGLSIVLERACVEAMEVSLAVRSRGTEHRYSGPLGTAELEDGVLRVAAPSLWVRVEVGRLSEAWIVRAPSLDGPTSTLELLDRHAMPVCSVTSRRVPGRVEPVAWTALLDGLPTVL